MVILNATLVTSDLSIKLVDQLVKGRVEVMMRTLGKHIVALYVDHAFGTLPSLGFFLLFND